MVLFRVLVNSFAFALAETGLDGLHLLQTHAQVQVHGQAAEVSPECKAARDALQEVRGQRDLVCPENEDVTKPPEDSSDEYKIFPPPEPSDPSTLKSCDHGWMAHTTSMHTPGKQCWAPRGTAGEVVRGPFSAGTKITQEESNHVTPEACITLVHKWSRLTGLCNPNATSRRLNLPNNYQFTGCTAEFFDQSSPDVLQVPAHLTEDVGLYNNLRRTTKYGHCMMCGAGRLGPYNYNVPMVDGASGEVAAGKAGLIRRDRDLDTKRMTCILNPEEKDGFQLYHMK